MDREQAVMGRTSMPRLPDATELAGDWRIEGQGGLDCDLVLDASVMRFEGAQAPAHDLTAATRRLTPMGLGEVRAWRPSPDGIALLRDDGSLVVFLNRNGTAYEGRGPDGERLRLVRA